MSPIFPSPMHDFGYDVADYTDIEAVFGSLADFDSPVAAARERGLDLLLDLVPCHTSIEHPWFREHPDWYIWPRRSEQLAVRVRRLGLESARWALVPALVLSQQPDLNWRNPEVVAAMQDVLRFWLERGVAGYRVDAIDRLLKDAQLRDDPPAVGPFGLPLRAEEAKLSPTHSRNAPDTGQALGRSARRSASLHGRRGVPARAALAAPLLEDVRCGFRVRVAARGLLGRRVSTPWRSTPGARRAGRCLGALEPRLGPARGTRFGARERTRRGDAPAHAAGHGLPLPGRRDRPGPTSPADELSATTARAATASVIRCDGTGRARRQLHAAASRGFRSLDPEHVERRGAAPRIPLPRSRSCAS